MYTDLHDGFWLGFDVSKDYVDGAIASVHARPEQWSRLPTGHFSCDAAGVSQLAKWLEPSLSQGPCLGICVESTGVYSVRFASLIASLGLPEVSIVNPALPLAFRKSLGLRDKCDRVDGAVLALYGVVHRPSPKKTMSDAHRQLRSLWRLHEDYGEDLRAWKNRLEQADDSVVRKSLMKTIKHLESCQAAVWKNIETWTAQKEQLAHDSELLRSIPGVGKKTATMVLAEFGDLRGWKRNEIVSYAGLFPAVYSSGSSVARKPHIAGGGGARIRKALYMPACSLSRTNNPIAQWGQTLKDKGKSKMAVIVAMMRKLLLLMRGVLVSGIPYENRTKLAKTTN